MEQGLELSFLYPLVYIFMGKWWSTFFDIRHVYKIL